MFKLKTRHSKQRNPSVQKKCSIHIKIKPTAIRPHKLTTKRISHPNLSQSSLLSTDITDQQADNELSFTKQHRNPAYFTNPIFYVNGEPHLGHLYTTVLTDTIKRWKQSQGDHSIVLGGTDEHGIKVQEASQKAGFATPKEFCDQISDTFSKTWDTYNLKTDLFLRTTSPEHTESVQWMWKQLARNGHIYLGKHQGWYCKSDETFVPETQLIKRDDGSFTTQSGHEVTWLEEENFKFRLSKFIEPLLAYYRQNPSAVLPEKQLKNVFNLTDGMQDISISRLADKLEWSIDVPDDVDYFDPATNSFKKGSEITNQKHKVYVWLDALNIYVTGARKAAQMLADNQFELSENTTTNPRTNDVVNITAEPESIYQQQKAFFDEQPQHQLNQHHADEYQQKMSPFWPPSGHIVGKDILKFHAVYWPAFLMGSGLQIGRAHV